MRLRQANFACGSTRGPRWRSRLLPACFARGANEPRRCGVGSEWRRNQPIIAAIMCGSVRTRQWPVLREGGKVAAVQLIVREVVLPDGPPADLTMAKNSSPARVIVAILYVPRVVEHREIVRS